MLRPYAEAYQKTYAAQEPKAHAEQTPPSERPLTPRIILGTPLAGYLTIILLCVIMGVVLASPWVLYQAWAFVGVALYPHERRIVYTYGPASLALFFSGAALFYLGVLPVGLAALMSPTAALPEVDPSPLLGDYFRFVAWMTLIFGLAFQTPLVVLFLARSGLVPLEALARKQRIVILVMCILGAVLTPTQDPVTMLVLTVPLVALYEVGLLVAWLSERRRRRQSLSGRTPPAEEPT